MNKTDLAYLPAHKALEMFRTRSLSPVEHMQAIIDRAAETEPKVNALPMTYFDQAMDAAKKAEARYATGNRTRALEGLAVGIKDESMIAGMPTTNGSLSMKDNIAEVTSPVNEKILKAGGIVHARTATPEFSCTVMTHTKLWGVTRNPWNLSLTPGGSSGGSAASLASGTSALATGSDIGGSIRVPSSTCGLFGLKPTFGRNPADSPFNRDLYAVDGALARTAKDLVLLQNVMCGPHRNDMVSIRPRLRISSEVKSLKGWKIAYSPDLGFYEVSEDVRRNTEASLDVFRAAGAEVDRVDLTWTRDVLDGAMSHLEHLFGGSLRELVDEDPDRFMPYTRALVDGSRRRDAAQFLAAGETANAMYAELSRIFARYRLLICPTTALEAVSADCNGVDDLVLINGKPVHPLHGWIMTVPFNMLNHCPVMSAPSGHAKSGVPTGVQIVGRTYCDNDVCAAALAYENERGMQFADAATRPGFRAN